MTAMYIIVVLALIHICSVYASNQNIQVLHLSDIHYDPLYTPGAAANCLLGSTGLGCCRSLSIPIPPYKSCSVWGDYNCDSPISLIDNSLRWAATQFSPDIILITGDAVGHHDFTQTWSQNLECITTVTRLIESRFPNAILVPVLGNHDTYPIDQFYPYLSNKIVNDVTDTWSKWVNVDTFKLGGFYSRVISNNTFIVINSLLYDSNNLVTKLFPKTDLDHQFKWLCDELDAAVQRDHKVWLLGHIPPSYGEADNYANNRFKTILSKYARTIVYSIWGHSHQDSFLVINSTSLGLVGPSLMPSGKYPEMRQYIVSPQWNIVDYNQYYLNLTLQITSKDFIGYDKLYNFHDTYGYEILNVASYTDLISRLKVNRTLFDTYYRYYSPFDTLPSCDDNCRNSSISELTC
jgi:predicted MPP superfamily phosphohydrolase